jgi:hypothetical protein
MSDVGLCMLRMHMKMNMKNGLASFSYALKMSFSVVRYGESLCVVCQSVCFFVDAGQ